MRVVITGNTGVGKTTLAKKIAKKHKLQMIESFASGHAGDQKTILNRAIMNHIQLTRLKNVVADRHVVDVYVYEKIYLDCEDLAKLAIETAKELSQDTVFIIMSQQKRQPSNESLVRDCITAAEITEEILKRACCPYILT